MHEVDILHVQALERTFDAGPHRSAVGLSAFGGDIKRVALHVPDGRAHDLLAFVLAVVRCGVEVIDAPGMGVENQFCRAVDVIGRGESHAAETDH